MGQTRQKKNIHELLATAMLLGDGWSYDPADHTMCYTGKGALDCYDADTMELLGLYLEGWAPERRELVKKGMIGCRKERSHAPQQADG